MKIVLFFTAPWCKACRNLAPHLAKVKAAGVTVQEINVETDTESAAEYDIMQLPTLVFLQDDAILGRKAGFSDSMVEELYRFAGVAHA